jgi:hypothetical protein
VKIGDLQAEEGTAIALLGHDPALNWRQDGPDLAVEWPPGARPAPAHALKLVPPMR